MFTHTHTHAHTYRETTIVVPLNVILANILFSMKEDISMLACFPEPAIIDDLSRVYPSTRLAQCQQESASAPCDAAKEKWLKLKQKSLKPQWLVIPLF